MAPKLMPMWIVALLTCWPQATKLYAGTCLDHAAAHELLWLHLNYPSPAWRLSLSSSSLGQAHMCTRTGLHPKAAAQQVAKFSAAQARSLRQRRSQSIGVARALARARTGPAAPLARLPIFEGELRGSLGRGFERRST